MSKHTPVGWILQLRDSGSDDWVTAPNAVTTTWKPGTDTETSRWVRFYLEPPESTDLLEVLKGLLENGACYYSAIELDPGFSGERWETKARAAIAKAEGRTK